MPFECRILRTLLRVFAEMRMFAIVHVGDGDDEGDDEGRCSVGYLIVKASLILSALRMRLLYFKRSRCAKSSADPTRQSPRGCREPRAESSPHPPLSPRSSISVYSKKMQCCFSCSRTCGVFPEQSSIRCNAHSPEADLSRLDLRASQNANVSEISGDAEPIGGIP